MRHRTLTRRAAADVEQQLAQIMQQIEEQNTLVEELDATVVALSDAAESLANSDASDMPEIVEAIAGIRQQMMAASMRMGDANGQLEALVAAYDDAQAQLQQMQMAEAA